MMIIQENVLFPSQQFLLEGVLSYAEDSEGNAGAVIAPPHPYLGGDMENNVVACVAKNLAHRGLVTLRFNYRGVGKSQGRAESQQEAFEYFWQTNKVKDEEDFIEDVIGAIVFLQGLRKRKIIPIHLIGYSFGAYVAAHACMRRSAKSLSLISPPVARMDFSPLEQSPLPKLIVCSNDDFACSIDEIRKAYEQFHSPKKLEIIPSEGHFFIGKEDRVAEIVWEFLGQSA